MPEPNGRTDEQAKLLHQYREFSVLTRDKNGCYFLLSD